MDDYLTKMKMFVDNLGTIEHLILDEDLVFHVLANVKYSKYDLIVANLTSKTLPRARSSSSTRESHR